MDDQCLNDLIICTTMRRPILPFISLREERGDGDGCSSSDVVGTEGEMEKQRMSGATEEGEVGSEIKEPGNLFRASRILFFGANYLLIVHRK